MRHVFIINPAAGKKNSVRDLLDRVTAAFPAGDFESYTTARAGDARRLAEEAIARGDTVRLYACGGDGTLNEVVNAAAGHENAAVTNVPMGTGNDFLRLFGKEGRWKFRDIAALREGPQGAMDLMDCNGLLGLNVVCAGVDARVAANVGRFKRLPLITGTGAYVLSLIAEVCGGITRPMRVEMGPIRYEGPTAILCVCNGQYYGGGFHPSPDAMPDDGALDMILVGDVSLPWFLRYVKKYATGRYRECGTLVRDFRGDAVTFSSREEITAVVDGEVLRDRSFTLTRSQRRVNFFWPVGTSYRPERRSTL